MNLSKFIPHPLATMVSMAEPDTGTALPFGIGRMNEGPLVRMLRGEPVLPQCPHYDSLATGICSLLGTVDPQLIEDAMTEKAAGVTLH